MMMNDRSETTSHRLVLPADSNHHSTLYAGSLMRFALEASYATACRAVGEEANLLLRRVVSIECRQPVRVGTLVEIRGAVLQVRQAYLVVGVVGMPLESGGLPWMDGLLGFVQIDEKGIPIPFLKTVAVSESNLLEPLRERLGKLSQVRGATADWLSD